MEKKSKPCEDDHSKQTSPICDRANHTVICKQLSNDTTKATQALLTVQNHPSTCCKIHIFFSELCESQKKSTTQKNPYKLKAKLRASAPHYASEQFVNKEAITECNSHLYAAAGEMDRWGWMVAVWGVSLWMSCACHCEEVHKYRSRQWLYEGRNISLSFIKTKCVCQQVEINVTHVESNKWSTNNPTDQLCLQLSPRLVMCYHLYYRWYMDPIDSIWSPAIEK